MLKSDLLMKSNCRNIFHKLIKTVTNYYSLLLNHYFRLSSQRQVWEGSQEPLLLRQTPLTNDLSKSEQESLRKFKLSPFIHHSRPALSIGRS